MLALRWVTKKRQLQTRLAPRFFSTLELDDLIITPATVKVPLIRRLYRHEIGIYEYDPVIAGFEYCSNSARFLVDLLLMLVNMM